MDFKLAQEMVAMSFSSGVFFFMIFGHVVAADYVTQAEFESLKRRIDSLEASLGE